MFYFKLAGFDALFYLMGRDAWLIDSDSLFVRLLAAEPASDPWAVLKLQQAQIISAKQSADWI